MVDSAVSEATLAGYRILRKLGVGSRADVYLAAGRSRTVALKVFAAGVDPGSVRTELEALSRIESPHLVRLLDLARTGDSPPSLVLDRVRGGSLATLLRERRTLERGEVVTLLAPLARLIAELHSAGIAHTKIGVASIHLAGSGAPVLLGLGHATLFAAGASAAALDIEPAAMLDRAALGAMALALLARDASRDPRDTGLAEWIGNSQAASEFPAELEERLFGWAEAMPIAFSRNADPHDSSGVSTVPLRIGSAVSSVAVPESLTSTPPESPTVKSTSTPALPHWLPTELVENPFGELRRRGVLFVRGVRRPFWIGAAVAVVGLVLALALLPSDSAAPTAHAAFHTASPRPVYTPAPLPADPLLALPLLLKARTRCFRDLSVLCLDTVDESSSAAFSSDAAAIQQIQEGGEEMKSATIAGNSASLVERLGDSALLSLGASAPETTGGPESVLMIKSHGAWRIRDFLTGEQATGSSVAPPG